MAIAPIQTVERALRDAGIPIDGVSIGTLADRSTWRAFYQLAATDQQRAQGDALILSVDLADPTLLAEVRADLSTMRMNDEAVRAIVQGLWESIPAPTMTLVQLRSRILTIYRGLI
jgi:hypothetical protein